MVDSVKRFLFSFPLFLRERKQKEEDDDESGKGRQFVSCFSPALGRAAAMDFFFVWYFIPIFFFNLIVIRPMCDSEWSLLCHSILAFCFTSLFLLCKNMTYFSLCTDYFV